jgi:hypothetical protein
VVHRVDGQEMKRAWHYLRIAWTIFLAMLCVLWLALWVRSCWWVDRMSFALPAHTTIFCNLMPGSCGIEVSRGTLFPNLKNKHTETSEWLTKLKRSNPPHRIPTRLLGNFYLSPSGIIMPYWLLILLTAVAGAMPWLQLRFSLRTLLIAITLVALALGLLISLR